MFGIEGLRVLITPGASGIGFETARGLVEEGASVHICDVSEHAFAELTESDPRLYSTRADLSDRSAAKRLFDDVVGRLGGLDVLVNNAGISDPRAAWRRSTGDVGRVSRSLPDRSVQLRSVRCAAPSEKRERIGRKLVLGGRALRISPPKALCRGKMGRDRTNEITVVGTGRIRNQGQRDSFGSRYRQSTYADAGGQGCDGRSIIRRWRAGFRR